MPNTLLIDRYIKLIVNKPLEQEEIKTWFKIIKEYGPKGILITLRAINNEGNPSDVRLVHREVNNKHEYIVPLARDLLQHEVGEIVNEFALKFPNLDFDIETNERRLSKEDRNKIDLKQEKHDALCLALEKKKHNDWVKERINSGWRYGPTFDINSKMHPLLLPWEQLPEKFKNPDMEWPQKLIDLLYDNGYVVIDKDELNNLLKLIHKTI